MSQCLSCTLKKACKICQVLRVTRVSMCFTSCSFQLDPGVKFPHYDLFCFSPWIANTAKYCWSAHQTRTISFVFVFCFDHLFSCPICTPGCVWGSERLNRFHWLLFEIWFITFPFALAAFVWRSPEHHVYFQTVTLRQNRRLMCCGELPNRAYVWNGVISTSK